MIVVTPPDHSQTIVSLAAVVLTAAAALFAWRSDKTARRTLEEARRQTTMTANLYEHSKKVEAYTRLLEALEVIRLRYAPDTDVKRVRANYRDTEQADAEAQEAGMQVRRVLDGLQLQGITGAIESGVEDFRREIDRHLSAVTSPDFPLKYAESCHAVERAVDTVREAAADDLERLRLVPPQSEHLARIT